MFYCRSICSTLTPTIAAMIRSVVLLAHGRLIGYISRYVTVLRSGCRAQCILGKVVQITTVSSYKTLYAPQLVASFSVFRNDLLIFNTCIATTKLNYVLTYYLAKKMFQISRFWSPFDVFAICFRLKSLPSQGSFHRFTLLFEIKPRGDLRWGLHIAKQGYPYKKICLVQFMLYLSLNVFVRIFLMILVYY